MEFVNVLLGLISSEYKIEYIKEDFEEFKSKIQINSMISSTLDSKISESIIKDYITKDNIKIYFNQKFNSGLEDTLYTYSKGDDILEFINLINEEATGENLEAGECYLLEINIYKNFEDGYGNIYSFKSMVEYLLACDLTTLLYLFNKIIFENEVCIFNIKEKKEYSFNTDTIYFTSNVEKLKDNLNISQIKNLRNKYIESRANICNFKKESNYSLIPNDFEFKSKEVDKELKLVFDKIKIIFALISIADISNIVDNNKLEIIINGYKRIDDKIDFKANLNEKLFQYFSISNWIYSDGNIDDKVGIARNVISISIKDEKVIKIDDSLYASILSSYSIYLKDNVERYLEVKEKINDTLFDLSIKVTESANDIGKDLRSNILAILTFFITVVLTNSMSSGSLEKIFTENVTKLSILILIGSVVYMIFSTVEAILYKNRINGQLDRIKSSYSDVLEKSDINNILNNYDFSSDSKYMRNKIIFYVIIWIIFIVGMFIGILALSNYNLNGIWNLFTK